MTDDRQQPKRLSFLQRVRLLITLKLLLGFLIVSAVVGYVLLQSWIRQLRLEPVQATITMSKLEPCPDGMYSVDIRFSYTIDRVPFRTGKYRDDFRKLCLRKEEAEAILRKYPQGARVEAWFDPKHPKYAILDRSMGTLQKGYLIVVGCFAVIFSIILFLRRRQQRSLPFQGGHD